VIPAVGRGAVECDAVRVGVTRGKIDAQVVLPELIERKFVSTGAMEHENARPAVVFDKVPLARHIAADGIIGRPA
jgi:hypothetical protein